LLLSLNEEENRIYNIQKLAEKVIPGTIENGQVNIRAQIDSSQQDWEGLMTTVK
jgi:nesprin-1